MQDPPNLFSVRDRAALVVGGTRGIGRAIAWRLAEAGAPVLANYVRDDPSAEKLATQASAADLRLEVCRADVTSRKGLDVLAQRVADTFDALSILVFSAATGVYHPVEQLTSRHFDWTFGLNVRAFLELVRRLLPSFGTSASIVAVSSEGAERAHPQYTLVGASKGALEAMSRHLAVELAPRGIRVNVICPGAVLTDAWKVLPESERRLASATARAPRSRLTTLDEVAWATQFLCSDAAAGVVGHTLVVDGGVRVVGS